MKNKNVVFQTFALVSQLGFSMIGPIILGTIAGVFLERRYSVSLTIPFIILGVLVGARNVYVLVRHMKNTIAAQKDDEE